MGVILGFVFSVLGITLLGVVAVCAFFGFIFVLLAYVLGIKVEK
jgi:ABC-type multidrug transport system permease subunit